jgi:hypothetical protein
MEWLKSLQFLLSIFVDSDYKSNQALSCLNGWLVLVKFVVVELHQAFKCCDGKFPNAVEVIIVLILNHVVQVVNHVIQLLKSSMVVTQLQVGLATSLLKPDALVVMHS